jgi:pilus assembly protein Flp/PilA
LYAAAAAVRIKDQARLVPVLAVREERIMKAKILAFLRDETGLTTVEYAIAGTLVGLAVITAFTNLGTKVAQKIGEIVTKLG